MKIAFCWLAFLITLFIPVFAPVMRDMADVSGLHDGYRPVVPEIKEVVVLVN